MLQSLRNTFVVRQPNPFQFERPNFSKTRVHQKVDKTNDLSNPVTSNSVPTTKESKVVENDKVIAPGMFRINPFNNSREVKYVPNKPIKASVRTNPITVPQPHVITKKVVNSDSNGFSSTRVDITTKTRRPQPRSNTKNDRVPSAFKRSRIKNKEVEVEDYPRNLLLSKNKKHMSSECDNVKLAIRNDKSEIVLCYCKQCLITANHDVCVLNYVNGMNSCSKKQKANVSNISNQTKHKVMSGNKECRSNERLASPKPSKPRFCLRWSPTGRFFDIKGKIIASSESESQSDCSNGDNACTSNPSEPTIKRFPNSTFFLGRLSKFFLGTVRFGNDHVAAILGFGDLQWGNILITRVYFVEGLGHNLFSVGQFCDSDLEVAFRRNSCFVRSLEGVDLLKGNRSTNLYTINLHDMASASPICLMARATSTKSWLWHQRLSHLNFDTINDLAKNANQSKDEAPEVIKTFLKRITVLLQSPVIIIRTDNGTEFKNQILKEYFDNVGISHQASSVRTPQQNGVVERRNRTLVEAARTMLIFSRAPLFLWAEAIATACFTQNRSIIHRRFNKTPYELINGRKPDISFLHVFGALCYPKNDREDIGKLGAKGDIGFFIGYSADSCAYRVYNRRTKKIMETMNVGSPSGTSIGEPLDQILPMKTLRSDGDICMYALHVTIRSWQLLINQSNYVLEILKKYGMEACDPVGTPMEIKDKLDLDQNGSPVDATKYRSMIGALMYLTICIELTGFSDADYAGCKDTFKSTSGGTQFLGEKLLTDYGFHFNKIPIYCDSKSAIAISCNPVQHSRTKHIAVRYHFIKEHVEKGTIELYFVKTDYQLADLFTKALPVDRFNYLVRRLGMRSLSPKELERLAKSQ
ncbi:retrovirus-related pol polyprotein from transposon TNT 1-94 [Tanacetum coccineum]